MSDSQGFIIIQEQKHLKKDEETNHVSDTEAVGHICAQIIGFNAEMRYVPSKPIQT